MQPHAICDRIYADAIDVSETPLLSRRRSPSRFARFRATNGCGEPLAIRTSLRCDQKSSGALPRALLASLRFTLFATADLISPVLRAV